MASKRVRLIGGVLSVASQIVPAALEMVFKPIFLKRLSGAVWHAFALALEEAPRLPLPLAARSPILVRAHGQLAQLGMSKTN